MKEEEKEQTGRGAPCAAARRAASRGTSASSAGRRTETHPHLTGGEEGVEPGEEVTLLGRGQVPTEGRSHTLPGERWESNRVKESLHRGRDWNRTGERGWIPTGEPRQYTGESRDLNQDRNGIEPGEKSHITGGLVEVELEGFKPGTGVTSPGKKMGHEPGGEGLEPGNDGTRTGGEEGSQPGGEVTKPGERISVTGPQKGIGPETGVT